LGPLLADKLELDEGAFRFVRIEQRMTILSASLRIKGMAQQVLLKFIAFDH